jgi:hypothetical protein
VLFRAGELLRAGGQCVTEFDCATAGVQERWVRLESARTIGPWFRWASVGVDAARRLAGDVGLTITTIHTVGNRALATLAVT